MTGTPLEQLAHSSDRRLRSSRSVGRVALLFAALLLLSVTCVASLALGSMPVSLDSLSAMPFGLAPATDTLLVETLRAPRTALGVLVGAALGGAGALMQSVTRSPLADPGLLGVNAGAATLVVAGICFFGATSIEWQMTLAFAGAAAATLVVYGIGNTLAQPSGSSVPLLLAGLAVTAALGGLSTIMLLNDPTTFDAIRQWSAGSLSTNGFATPAAAVLPITAGLLLSILVGGDLNILSLGDESAAGLGVNITRLRAMIFLAITLLCGSATAVVGPIGFVGLMAPHVARMMSGPDERWVLLLAVLIAPSLLLASDVAGRLLLRPAELQVGIVTAFVGAPVLIALARRRLA